MTIFLRKTFKPKVFLEELSYLTCHVISTLVYNLSLSTNKHSTMRAKTFNFATLPPSTRTWHMVGGQSVFRHQTEHNSRVYFLRSPIPYLHTTDLSRVRPSLHQHVLVCMFFFSLYLWPQLFTASIKWSLKVKLPNLFDAFFSNFIGNRIRWVSHNTWQLLPPHFSFSTPAYWWAKHHQSK